MALWDNISHMLALEPWQHRAIDWLSEGTTPLETQIANIRLTQQAANRPWRLPSITEALGVPAIQRAVTLIANTVGSLPVQGFRDGALMSDPPRLIVRPDPFETPGDFYRDTAYCVATRGEAIWWIATRDGDGLASALVVVPPAELHIDANPRDRLRPRYTWGDRISTRYSGANPTGEFVHIFYLREPGKLRGTGPLQLAMAAASVSVEAQEWAANFYAEGGAPSTIIKSAEEITPAEATALKSQWISEPNNVPRVVDIRTDSVTQNEVNPQGAQMLQAREYQNGEAARMFGIPGSLLDYGAPGSSLTYQNVEQEYTKFVRTCLSVNYLEKIEQAMTDLLPRTTAAYFYTQGLLRADIKTRYDVYGVGIDKGIISPEEARTMEGLAPGSPEVAPVPFSPPTAIPTTLPVTRATRSAPAELVVRCTGVRRIRANGITKMGECRKVLSRTGEFTGRCQACGKDYPSAIVA